MGEMKARVVITADGQGVIKESKKVLKAMGDLGKDVRTSFATGIGDANSLMSDLANRAGQAFGMLRNPLLLATGGLIGLGVAAFKAGKAALSLGGDFDKQMANVSTLVDTNVVNMEELGRRTIEIAKELRRNPALVADALYEWISANGKIDDGLQEFKDSVKASVAGVTEAKTAVDGITTILNSYGKEAGSAAHVSDLMFQTVNKGKIRFEELAQHIGLVASTAKGAGVPINDLMAAIATSTAQGIRPSSAMEGLRSAISNIIKPSEQAMTTAKLLGLQWGYGALKAKGLAGFLKDVREKTKGNTEAMAQLFGDISGLNVVLSLTGEGAGMFADNLLIMEQAAGATDVAFKKQQNTWDETVNGLIAIGQAALVNIFNKFKPYMIEAGQWVIDNWPAVIEQIKQTGKDLASMVSLGLTPFRLAWEGVKGAIEIVIRLLQGDLDGAATAARTALVNLSGELTDFKVAWESISIPPWVTTLGSLAVSLATFKLGVQGLTLAARGLAGAFGWLEGVFTALAAGNLAKLIGSLMGSGGLAAALALLGDKAAFALYAFGGLVDAIVAGATAILTALGAVIGVSAAVAAAIIAAVVAIVAIGIYLWKHWDEVKAKAKAVWEALPGIISAAWEGIKQAVVTGVQAVGTFFTQTIPSWWTAFGTWLSDTWTGISTWFSELPGKLGYSIGYVAGWLATEIPAQWTAFGTWLASTLTSITTWFSELPGKLVAGVAQVAGWLASEIPAKWTAFKTWISDVAKDIETFFTGLPAKFTDWLTKAADAVEGLWATFREKGRQLGIQVWEGLKSSVTGAINSAVDSARSFMDNLKKGFSDGKTDAGGTPDVPHFAAGGIVRRAMLAVIGEGGEQEAVVPESKALQFLPTILKWAGLRSAGNGAAETLGGLTSSVFNFAAPNLALPAMAGGPGGGIQFGNLTVIVQAPPGTADARAFGEAAGDGLYRQLTRMIKV